MRVTFEYNFVLQLEGRKISSTQLIRVLSILRPWELCYPDISAAIEVSKPSLGLTVIPIC